MSIAIKPVRFAENGFMTRPFALGGEGAEGLDPAVKYRSCLQNWVIDTGSEVILVDTGVPEDFPFGEPTEDATIYVGKKIKPYVEALADLGYKPEQVSKILITHKHIRRCKTALQAALPKHQCRFHLIVLRKP